MENSLNKMPSSFCIFGCGKDVEPVIEALKGVLPVGVDAVMIKEGEFPEPTDYDKMVIFLMSDHINDTCNACYAFYQADVLSLIIHTPDMEFVPGAGDCYIEVETNEMQSIVEALIAPLVYHGPINYNFQDLRVLLGDASYSHLWTVEGEGATPLKSALEKIDAEVSSYFKLESERMAILISCNPQTASNVWASEIEHINNFISGFNDGIDARWGFYFDPGVKPGNIRITVIITGNNIQFDD